MLTNLNLYAEWKARNYGLSDYIAMGSQFVWPFTKNDEFDSQFSQTATVCTSLYFDQISFPSYCNQTLGLAYTGAMTLWVTVLSIYSFVIFL